MQIIHKDKGVRVRIKLIVVDPLMGKGFIFGRRREGSEALRSIIYHCLCLFLFYF
jgi:hypothetical protein